MLHNIQKSFLDGIFKENNIDILSAISIDGKFSPVQRFQIYQNSVKFILTDLLKNLYPITVKLVGNDFFNYVAFSYIKTQPPKSGDMTFYGDEFSNFLSSFAPVSNLPYIEHIANLEWGLYSSSMAGKETSLTPDMIENTPEKNIPKLKFNFQPHVIFLNAPYAIDKIWQAISNNKTEELSDIKLEQETYLLIYCSLDKEVNFIPMDKSAYQFMLSLKNGNNFTTAVEKALVIDPDFKPEQHLSYLLSNQILSKDE